MSKAGDEPRVVCYVAPSAFIRAVLPFDTWHLNLDLGKALEWLAQDGDTSGKSGWERIWLAVWTGEQLDLTLASISSGIAICSPMHSASLSASWLSPRLELLAHQLHQHITEGSQPTFYFVRGATALVKPFARLYGAFSGVYPEDNLLCETLAAHCPRARISLDPPALPEGHMIRVVELGDEPALKQLTPLIRAFRSDINGPDAEITQQAAKAAEAGVRFREYSVYVVDDGEGKEKYVGYVRDGRTTQKHAAITNVFTLPHWRGRGIGEALVRAVVIRLLSETNRRQDLLAELLPPGTKDAKVEDICLFTESANLAAQSVYRRVGFGFSGAEWDEKDGKSWESCIELVYPGYTDFL